MVLDSSVTISISAGPNKTHDLEPVHTELIAIAVEYPFLAMPARANAIVKSQVWTEPYSYF